MDPRPVLRKVVVATVTGALTVTAAWAGTGLAPRALDVVAGSGAGTAVAEVADATDPASAAAGGVGTVTETETAEATIGGDVLEPGWALVGAAKNSIEPRPEDHDGRWETDRDACRRMDESVVTELVENTEGHIDHLANAGSPWPENPDCIYMGGYGLGPTNPITAWRDEDEATPDLGLWVRSVSISDGADTLVLTVLDGEGYWWDYASKCEDCGTKQIAAALGEELGIDPSGIVIASTHSHTAPDFIGGWGFVPDWYMDQVADTIRQTITEAVTTSEPAVLEVGEERARPFNRERRDTYRAAEEQQLAWLRAYVPGGGASGDTPGGDQTARTIATVGAYAAHPTTQDEETGVAHADWPGLFAHAVEERFGGVGLHLMTGLGNLSASGGTAIGAHLAELIPATGDGTRLADTDVRTDRDVWVQPATNVPLTTLGAAGFFDRKFVPGPASIRTGEAPDTAPCLSTSPFGVEVAAGAARIGDLFALTTAPGEIFANFSNTLKEKSGALVTMPIGQAMDALGYMPQEFEMSAVGQQGLGFVAGGYVIVNYEDSYAIDRCFGDAALESSIRMLDALGER
ncbi:MAG: hypothetical protein KY461_11490 [Actinobacteria bacterium]|nr:hypothetical protein [Actinomycetota bacterium]